MNLNLEVAKDREKRPGLKWSRCIIEMAHENDEFHEQAHAAMIAVLSEKFPTMIFLGGSSDGEPFDKPLEDEEFQSVPWSG